MSLKNFEIKEHIVNESDTKYSTHIPESASDVLYNSIVRIEFGSIIGTGFFVKIKIKEKIKYFLITCNHVISKNDISLKNVLDIYYGKKNEEKKRSIILDNKQRYIKCFEGKKDITVIEIIKDDKIPENKYLYADLSYKYGYEIFKNGKFLLAGYPKDEIYQKERHISSGEIKKINGFEFEHSLDTRHGSSGAPICFLKNTQVIGIHKQGNKKKCINYGTFIGVIIDDLEKDYKELKENIQLFYRIEDYNNCELLEFHKKVIKAYNNQNEKNFYIAFNELKNYLSQIEIKFNCTKEEFLNSLKNIENIEKFKDKVIDENTFPKGFFTNLNIILNQKDANLLKKITYFIGCLIKSFDISNNILYYDSKNISDLFYGTYMSYEELVSFKENINKIICFKSFLSTTKSKKIALGFISSYKDDNYRVLLKIIYEHKDNCKIDCYNFSRLSQYKVEKEILFNLFAFFKIINVDINDNNKKAEITLYSIGKEKMFEIKINQLSKDNKNDIKFKTINNIIEIS